MKTIIACGECGAMCPEPQTAGVVRRFQSRHPKLCQERREFNRKLAEGVRCVEDEERRTGTGQGQVDKQPTRVGIV